VEYGSNYNNEFCCSYKHHVVFVIMNCMKKNIDNTGSQFCLAESQDSV